MQRPNDETDGQTDRRTPDSFIDSAASGFNKKLTQPTLQFTLSVARSLYDVLQTE